MNTQDQLIAELRELERTPAPYGSGYPEPANTRICQLRKALWELEQVGRIMGCPAPATSVPSSSESSQRLGS